MYVIGFFGREFDSRRLHLKDHPPFQRGVIVFKALLLQAAKPGEG